MAKRGNPQTLPPDLTTKKDMVAECITVARYFSNRSPVKKHDPDECRERINEYFEYCKENGILPTVEGMCSALRITRQCANIWEHTVGLETGQLIAAAKTDISNILVQLSVTGEINPIFPMFLLKCNCGYSEKEGERIMEIEEDRKRVPTPRAIIAKEISGLLSENELPELPDSFEEKV